MRLLVYSLPGLAVAFAASAQVHPERVAAAPTYQKPGIVLPPPAERLTAEDTLRRVAYFDLIQRLCKVRLLSTPEMTTSFIEARAGSISEVCECAAALGTAQHQTAELAAVSAHQSLIEVDQNIPRCFSSRN